MKAYTAPAILLSAVLGAALAGCATDRNMDRTGDTAAADGATSPYEYGSPGTTPYAAGGTAGGAGTSQNWSGVVIAVDPILRQDAASMGVGMVGAAAAGGTMLTEGSPNDKVYRITMRADDGTTQTVVVDSIPTYKSGDRVRYRNGTVLRE